MMQSFSAVSSGGFSAYIISPPRTRSIRSYSTCREDVHSNTLSHPRPSVTTSASASNSYPYDRHTPHPLTDIEVVTRGSGDQFLSDPALTPTDIHLQAAPSSYQRSKEYTSSIISRKNDRAASLKHRDSILDPSPASYSLLPRRVHVHALPIRVRSSKSEPFAEPVSKKGYPQLKQYNSPHVKPTPLSTECEAFELHHVVDVDVLQHNRDCQRSHKIDISFLTELIKVLAGPQATLPRRRPSPLVVPPIRVQELGTQSSTSHTTYTDHASNGAEDKRRSNKRTGKQREKDTGSESESGRNGNDDRKKRRSQKPATLFGELAKSMLICPFLMSSRYHRLKECSRCLTADLETMEKLTQHLRRTHNYCVRCLEKFPSEDEFEAHRPQDNQCQGCHELFGNAAALNYHKQMQKECSSRDRGTEETRYAAIWESIAPEQPCPGRDVYRTNHAAEFLASRRAKLLLRTQPQRCKEYILNQLSQGGNMNGADLQLVSDFLGCSTTTSRRESQLIGASESIEQNDISSQSHFAGFESPLAGGDMHQYPDFSVIDSSFRDEVDPQHELDAILAEPSQLSASQSELPWSSQQISMDHATLPSDFQASSSTTQTVIQHEIVGCGSHVQPATSPYPYQFQGSPPSDQHQRSQQTSNSQHWTMPHVTPHHEFSFPDHASLPTRLPIGHSFNSGPLGQISTQPSFHGAGQSQTLGRNSGASSSMGQGVNYSYSYDPHDSQMVNQATRVTEQIRTPRLYHPTLNTLVSIPPPSDTTSFSDRSTSQNYHAPPANPMPGPWFNHAIDPIYRDSYGPQHQLQQQPQRPTKRKYYDQRP